MDNDNDNVKIMIVVITKVIITTVIINIVIWQGSLGVNPSVLIGSYLVGILPYRPFPWKWSLRCVFFVFG